MWGPPVRPVELPLQLPPFRAGRFVTEDQGDLRSAGALRLPAHPRVAATGGVAREHQEAPRIYKELGLQVRNKHPKRRVKAKLRDDRAEAVGPNDVWAMDFVHDQLALGNKLRILTIVDTHSRFCPATDPRFTYRGEDVV